MYTCELHCHTKFSKCSDLELSMILERCLKKGINCIAITDHNSIEGALALQKISSDKLTVIVGEEILTSEGELIAYFLTSKIPALKSPEETIKLVRRQGGLVGVSHPFDRIRKEALRRDSLERIKDKLDFLEVFNSRCLFNSWNQQALRFFETNQLLHTVGSDAHFAEEIGKSTMELADISDPAAFLDSLSKAKTECKLARLGLFKSKLRKLWQRRK
ncbi:MAG: PHP domain-containing protein [Candidatus Gracilibacteria bacterium]|nr:PHP domain-containing protein [Candidatus Gracilibacteria bacterium]